MADEGWIKVYRKLRQSFVWTDANQLKLWLLILMKASHSGNKFLFNGKEIAVSSGQLVTGRDALASEFNDGVTRDHQIVARTLWRWLKLFEKEGMLSIKSTSKYSVITVVNWVAYQSDDQQVSISRPSSVHQLSTIKNAKNAKNSTPSSDVLIDRFNALWQLYPKKQGKQNAFKSYKKAIKDGITDDRIKTGIEAYIRYLTKEQTDPQYIKQGSSFFNQRSWEDDWSGGGINPEPQESKPLDKAAALLHEIEDEMSLHPTVSRQEAAEITARMFTENGRTTTADKILKFLDKYERKKGGNEQ
jgi:hypothetical protein